MKKYLIILSAILLMGGLVWADDTEGSVTFKYTVVSDEDSKVKASEYRDDEDSAGFAVDLTSQMQDHGLFLISGHTSTKDDHSYGLSLWTGPHFSISASYREFVHNTIHDPLTNLEAISDVKVTRFTDFNPETDYGVVYTDTNARIDYAVHGYENLKLYLSYRDESRKGWKQARTVSHCSTCHVVGMDRKVDQSMQDGEVGASLMVKNFRLAVSHLSRTFKENGATPTFTYEDALHPALRTPVFEDRVQYDLDEGAQLINQVPKVEKTQDNIQLDFNWNSGDLTAAYTMAEVTNKTTHNAFDYNALLARGKQRLSEKMTLRLRFRTYEIDNDDYFVDTAEPAAIAGPYVGETYRQHYGYDPDFLRRSAMNRTVSDGLAELQYRYMKRGHLKFGLRYTSVDRDHFEVSEGEKETVTNKFYVDWRHWIPESWKLMANLSYSDISHPFGIVDGGCNPDMDTTPVGSPLAPGSLQYYEWQDAREYNLSNQPSKDLFFRFSASRPLKGTTTLMFNTRYKDQKNSDLDFSKWDRNSLMASLYLNWTAMDRWSWFAGYNYSDEETTTHVCIPVMDG
ncbi:MAG: GSU2204 family CXXCH-containing (seleno)protein [Acidobacteriota bacterium]